MLDLATVFDPDPARRPARHALLREARSLLVRAPRVDPATLPDGQGRPVLVIPAFLCGDTVTLGLRRFLGRCGFRAFGWSAYTNWGPTARILAALARRFDALYAAHGPLALVGISLGGLLARNLALDRPGAVRHVVTLGSPLRLPTASTIEPLIRLCARNYSAAISPARLLAPLPVPSTMIWSRDDGIVAGDSCWLSEPGAEAIEVGGSHLTIVSNPAARRAVVGRLAPG